MKYYNIDENIASTAHGMVQWQRQLSQNAENAARRILGCEGKGGCNA